VTLLRDASGAKTAYDYIVIGAGSAGAALAARLSEDPNASVLLIEAGGRDNHPLQLVPLTFLKLVFRLRGTWQYESEPERALGGRRLRIPRGRALGGTSSINAMIAVRGNARDYDRWREQGLDGWGYADVLPYFKRLESSWRGNGKYHGDRGPVAITPVGDRDYLFDPLAVAAAAAGVPVCDDPSGPSQDGIARMEATIGDGKRASTARAYLYPAMARPNLTILIKTLVTRVLVERGRAIGIACRTSGGAQTISAEREVILSGGSYNSPQLLMLSGIGPADHLKSVGVAAIHDLPGVGQNLAEHPNFLNIYGMKDRLGLTRRLRLDRAALALGEWYATHRGPFAFNGASANVFLRTTEGLDRPDAQLVVMPISNTAALWVPGLTAAPSYSVTVRVGALHPLSRGWVRLRSADPADTPRIALNIYEDPSDLDTMVRAVKATRAIFHHSPLKELVEREVAPGVEVASDADLAAAIRRGSDHRSHPVGTCRMGLDTGAVVDASLRVRGIEGLRVADASVMPDLPSGNTNLPSIMIGEKAADLIRGRNFFEEAA
jgi:choline dehydrogenase